MTPLHRLVTMGPIAAFSSNNRKFSRGTAAVENRNKVINTNPRPWPGGRRLPSVEDSRTALSPGAAGRNVELGEWLDRRDVMEDSTTRSEPEREWLEATLPDPTVGGFDSKKESETGLELPKNAVPVGHGH